MDASEPRRPTRYHPEQCLRRAPPFGPAEDAQGVDGLQDEVPVVVPQSPGGKHHRQREGGGGGRAR